jgi:hypothetical protein
VKEGKRNDGIIRRTKENAPPGEKEEKLRGWRLCFVAAASLFDFSWLF